MIPEINRWSNWGKYVILSYPTEYHSDKMDLIGHLTSCHILSELDEYVKKLPRWSKIGLVTICHILQQTIK